MLPIPYLTPSTNYRRMTGRPDDAPYTIVFEGYGHYLELSREQHYELFPRAPG